MKKLYNLLTTLICLLTFGAGSAWGATETVAWSCADSNFVTWVATGTADNTAISGDYNGLKGYGKWATNSGSACSYTHPANGVTYSFSNKGLQAGSGGKTNRCFYFTPQAKCKVTVAYAAQAGRPMYIVQGNNTLATGTDGIASGKAATISAEITDLTQDVYIYGGSSNKQLYGIFVDYEVADASVTTVTKITIGGVESSVKVGSCSFAFEYGTTGPLAVTTDADASATVKISDANTAKVDDPSTLTYSETLNVDVPAVGTDYYYYLEVTADGAETSYYEVVVSQKEEVKAFQYRPKGTDGSEYTLRNIFDNRFLKATIVANGTISLAANTSSEKDAYPHAFKIQGSGTISSNVENPYSETNANSGSGIVVVEAKENGLLIAYVTYNASKNKKNFRIWDNTDNKEVSNVEWDGAVEGKVQKAIELQALKDHTYILYAAGTGAFLFAGIDYSYAENAELANVKIGDVTLSAADLATLKAEKAIAINDFVSTTGAPVITAEGGVTFVNDGSNVYTATSWGETYTIDLSGSTFIDGNALLAACKYKVIDSKKTAIKEPAEGFANGCISAFQVGQYGLGNGQAPSASADLSNKNTFKAGWNTTIGFVGTEAVKITGIKVTGVSTTAGNQHKFSLASADAGSAAVITAPTDNALNGSTTVGDEVLFLVDDAACGEQFNLKFDGWFESFVTFTVYYVESVNVQMSNLGISTFCPVYSDVEIPEGLTAYTASINEEQTLVTLKAVEGGKLPKGCGVVLCGDEGEYTFMPTTEAAALDESNQMKGATEDITGLGRVFALGAGKDGKAIFGGWAGEVFPAGKAYLNVLVNEAVNPAPKVAIVIAGNGATGVQDALVSGMSAESNAYNLAGQKVGKDYKGIVVVNGRKLINK